jgi:hypothetical protein
MGHSNDETTTSARSVPAGVAARRPARLTDDARVWLVTFVVLAALGSCWALASPHYSGPDEPAHTVRAYSVAHGEVVGEEPEDPEAPGLLVETPELMAETNPACYAFQPPVTAECLVVEPSTDIVEARTSAGRHPPLYYGLTGLPSWITVSGKGLYLMRIASVVLSAAVLASAMVTARRSGWNRWMPTGVLLALTPMALYLFGLVNPNGLEVSAAIGAWVSGLALVGERHVDRRVLVRFVVAAVLLTLTRHLGPLWVGIIGVSLLLLAGWAGTRRLLRSRDVLVGLGVTAAAVVVQLAWLVVVKPLDTGRSGVEPLIAPTSDLQRAVIGQIGGLYREWVGLFGWGDTLSPELTYFGWAILFGGLVLVALAVASRRTSAVLLLLVAGMFVVPLVLEYPGVREADLFWQGRYTLPLIVGIPLVAAYGLSRSDAVLVRRGSLLGPVAGGLVLVAHVLAFAQGLRRYTVGSNGSIWFFTVERWSPPIPSLVLLAVYAAAILTWIWWCRPRPERPVGRIASDDGDPSEVATASAAAGH